MAKSTECCNLFKTTIIDKLTELLAGEDTSTTEAKKIKEILKLVESQICQCKKIKGTRPPSLYNQHMKKCASKPDKGGEGLPWKDCIQKWKEHKEAEWRL